MASAHSKQPNKSLGRAELKIVGNGVPHSIAFKDTYFDPEDGLGESQHVFLEGCRLPQMWQQHGTFVVGETGFGTGLNFLATWQAWKNATHKPRRLHFLSVEGFPLLPAQIETALSTWPELRPMTEQLLEFYPDPQPGYHRLDFENGSIALTLLLGPVLPTLKNLDAQVDAWFLDGFAPDRNPEMWNADVLTEVARLSQTSTRLATFTVAGQVRRDLEAQGFRIEKRPGWRNKREVLAAEFTEQTRQSTQEPWYRPPRSRISAPCDVAIIGSGLAGATAAHAFSKRGCNISIVEAEEKIASGASATPRAVLLPRLTADHSIDGQFYALAWRACLNLLKELSSSGFDLARNACGSLRLASNADEEKRQRAIYENGLLPPTLISLLNAKQASEVAGVQLGHGGLYFPQGGTVSSKRLCEALLSTRHVILNQRCTNLHHDNGRWHILGATGQEIATADMVVLANSLGTKSFHQGAWLPLTARLGQVSHPAPSTHSQDLRCVVAGGGYATPSESGLHTIGATFDHVAEPDLSKGVPAPTRNADERNFTLARSLSPGLFDNCKMNGSESWTGLRCTTADHLPLAGPLPDYDAYLADFADLRHGHRWSQYPDARYHPGLGVLTGLGAHGVIAAPLAAELLASQMFNEPNPLPRAVSSGLHPGRFIVRDLKRRQS